MQIFRPIAPFARRARSKGLRICARPPCGSRAFAGRASPYLCITRYRKGPEMTDSPQTIPTQGVHHITLMGASRQVSIDFWEGVLGMPFVFEQPNLDNPRESHLYFDPGDGRLITVFTDETRTPTGHKAPTPPGAVHHLAFSVSRAVFAELPARLAEHGISHSGPKDRGFMDSLYFRDPLGLVIELACYRFDVPEGHRLADVMIRAHRLRVAAGAHHIEAQHIAAALRALTAGRESLSQG